MMFLRLCVMNKSGFFLVLSFSLVYKSWGNNVLFYVFVVYL